MDHNLPTTQEVIHWALTGLLVQGQLSYVKGHCLYRGPNNTKCGVGHVLPDDLYHDSMEDNGVSVLIEIIDEYIAYDENMRLVRQVLMRDEPYLVAVQLIHDSLLIDEPPRQWQFRDYILTKLQRQQQDSLELSPMRDIDLSQEIAYLERIEPRS
jgi:hypothetical protein